MNDNAAIPAGLPRRLAALVYDALLLTAVWMASTAVWLAASGGAEPAGHLLALFQAYLLVITFLFLGGFWVQAGRTLGMQAWRLRVVTDGGGRLSWQHALSRFLGALVSWALLGGGFLWALVDRRGRTLHDHLSGTHVVLLPRPR